MWQFRSALSISMTFAVEDGEKRRPGRALDVDRVCLPWPQAAFTLLPAVPTLPPAPDTGVPPDAAFAGWPFSQGPPSSPTLHHTSHLPHCCRMLLGDTFAHSWKTIIVKTVITSQPLFFPVSCSSSSVLSRRKSDILLWSLSPSKLAPNHRWLSIPFPNQGRERPGAPYHDIRITNLSVDSVLALRCCPELRS